MAPLIDYEDFDYARCGHIGVLPDDDFNIECSIRGAKITNIPYPSQLYDLGFKTYLFYKG